MYIKVRTMDGSQNSIFTVSKLTSVEDFRCMIETKFDVAPDRQRLFYRGKQMEDGYKIFDYNINTNDVIQMMVKPILAELTNLSTVSTAKESPKVLKEAVINNNVLPEKSKYYEVGNLVDAQTPDDGSWWEAKIVKIVTNPNSKKKSVGDDGLLYFVKYERYEDTEEEGLKIQHIRPRARTKIALKKVKNGEVVMLNYNFEHPDQRGFWFDCKITRVINTRTKKTVIGTIITNKAEVEECHIFLIEEIFKIESNKLIADKTGEPEEVPATRKNGPSCSTCKDMPNKKCNDCGCNECGGKESPEQQLMCDECDQPFHIYCLDPPLEEIPDEEEWFCPLCKNDDTEIVKAGEKLKVSKKKAALVSSKSKSSRDWGKGFACAGRTKICTLVPNDHFGPVPGVEVGSQWIYRLQASEAGIHRPHVAGIHGRETSGAFSIVLAGGYEDDEDRGEEFTYTGSGGRDLSGNKRTAEQSSDQVLTRMNKALALNCNTPVNKNGAEAKNWKEGKPVRVVRNYKGKKHSKYAPDIGNRYDGIYKVVKYWQASGKSGFKVWRYLFRRDDPIPAPWTKEGKKRIEELGLTIVYPEGYKEAEEEEKENENSFVVDDDEESEKSKKKKGQKRKSMAKQNSPSNSPKAKKCKISAYSVPKEIGDDIQCDSENQKCWKNCLQTCSKGKLAFLDAVKENFICVCCQLLVHNPVTTPCAHNVCLSCLKSSFKAEVYSCPSCRGDLGKDYEKKVNKHLKQILNSLFFGYEAGR